MRPIVNVQNLGKQYSVGAPAERYSTVRESIMKAVRRPMGTLRGGGSHTTFWALKDVDFQVLPGEVVGIIGRNGAGKSTLLKILSRITNPTAGRAELYGRVGSLLEIGTGFHPELTGRENIFLNGAILGMRRDEISRKFDEIVDFAGIEEFLDTPVKRYSSGMYTRLAFAVAAHLESEILVVDEVLAVGDDEFQKKCLGKMEDIAKAGRTVLFVSHNMTAVNQLCTTGIYLSRGKINFAGSIEDTIKRYLDQNLGNEAEFANAPVKKARICQLGDELHLSVDYDLNEPVKLPCVGFVISDAFGNPIFGSNPLLDHASPGIPTRSGQVTTIVRAPHLVSGNYYLSLWFGDGVADFFQERHCLSFDVVNTDRIERPFTIVGSVVPQCEWHFETERSNQ